MLHVRPQQKSAEARARAIAEDIERGKRDQASEIETRPAMCLPVRVAGVNALREPAVPMAEVAVSAMKVAARVRAMAMRADMEKAGEPHAHNAKDADR